MRAGGCPGAPAATVFLPWRELVSSQVQLPSTMLPNSSRRSTSLGKCLDPPGATSAAVSHRLQHRFSSCSGRCRSAAAEGEDATTLKMLAKIQQVLRCSAAGLLDCQSSAGCAPGVL